MKKCNDCSKPAVYHATEIHNGVVEELHFCEEHFFQYVNNAKSPTPAEKVDEITAKIGAVTGLEDLDEIDKLVCPNCGISLREFRTEGRLGCPHDYIVFERILTPLLENVHGEAQHLGKFPKRAPEASRHQYRLIRMRRELSAAVKEEQYETAARLRDQIQQIETEMERPNQSDAK